METLTPLFFFSLLCTGQDKKAPLHIRRAYYDAHQEMDHTTTKLQGAAEDLKKCYENVLHEDALHQRVPSMTGAHYDSLRQVFAGRGGHKESAMLYWLQLSLDADPGQGGNDILSYFRVCMCKKSPFRYRNCSDI